MKKAVMLLSLFLVLLAVSVCAQGIDTGDTAWVMVAAAMVMIMTPALGFFYGGLVQKKNILTILTESFVIIALVSLLWVVIGYSLAFGPDVGGQGIIGSLKYAMLNGVGLTPDSNYSTTIPAMAFVIFQAMTAIITPALIIGAFAYRIKFSSFIIFILTWSTLVYAPIAHWVWGTGGWIRTLGAIDFAGGTVVHISAGISALAAALILRRHHVPTKGKPAKPHDMTMFILGAALLWFGWFGFNAGNSLSANGIAAHAFLITNTAGAAAALSSLLISWIHAKKPNITSMIIGAICGLIAITPAAGFVSLRSSIVIGAIAGIVCYIAADLMKSMTKVNDSLDVFACHGIGGITGVLLTGIFASKIINPAGANGLLAGNASLMFSQIIAVAATAAYAFIATTIILTIIDWITGLKIEHPNEDMVESE